MIYVPVHAGRGVIGYTKPNSRELKKAVQLLFWLVFEATNYAAVSAFVTSTVGGWVTNGSRMGGQP